MLNIIFGRNGKNIMIFGIISIVAGIICFVIEQVTNREFIITFFKSFSIPADYIYAPAGLLLTLFGWVQLRQAKKQEEDNSSAGQI
jgi:hypothetical protein